MTGPSSIGGIGVSNRSTSIILLTLTPLNVHAQFWHCRHANLHSMALILLPPLALAAPKYICDFMCCCFAFFCLFFTSFMAFSRFSSSFFIAFFCIFLCFFFCFLFRISTFASTFACCCSNCCLCQRENGRDEFFLEK